MSVRPLSPELQEIAIRDLNEDPKRISEDLEHIKTWLKKQPHLNVRTDDQWLIAFLRGCKYSLEKTKEKLDFYYSSRVLTPEFYGLRDPFDPVMQECLAKGYILPLLDLTPDGKLTYLTRVSLFEPGKVEPEDTFKIQTMICDILINENDGFVVNGFYSIIDMQFFTAGKLTAVTPTMVKKMIMITLKGMPVRPKGMYVINMPSYLEGLMMIIISFFPEKLKKRVKIIPKDDYDTLFEIFPKNMLPPEYGGEGRNLDDLIDYWKKRVESYKDWFYEDVNYKSDEKKRPGRPRTTEDVFGIEGSFRKLNVD